MKIRAAMMRRRVSSASAALAVAAGVLLAGAPVSAAPASAAPVLLPVPWKLVWLNGTAQGSYTVTQPPFGIGRTYAITGKVASSSAAECYFVRVGGDSLAYDSPRACGASIAAFTVKITAYTVMPVGIRLCRVVPPGCGPTLPLTGFDVL